MLRKFALILATNGPYMVYPLNSSFASLCVNLVFLVIIVRFRPYSFIRSGFFKDDRRYGLLNIMEIWCTACTCVGNICAIIGVFDKEGLEFTGLLFTVTNLTTFACLQGGFGADRRLAKKTLKEREKKADANRERRKKQRALRGSNTSGVQSGDVELEEQGGGNPLRDRDTNDTSISALTQATGLSAVESTGGSTVNRRSSGSNYGDDESIEWTDNVARTHLEDEMAAARQRSPSTKVFNHQRSSWLTTFDDANNALNELSPAEVASAFMEIGLDMYVEAVLAEHLDGEHLMSLALLRDESILDDMLTNVLMMGSDDHRDLVKDWLRDALTGNKGGVNTRSQKRTSAAARMKPQDSGEFGPGAGVGGDTL